MTLLSIKETSKLVGISTHTINRLRREGDFPIAIRLRGTIRFRQDEVEEWLLDRPRVNDRTKPRPKALA